MTWKDKLEIGLKDDAPYRRDNLPPLQKRPGRPATRPGDPSRSPEEPGAREAARQSDRRGKLRAEHSQRAQRTARKAKRGRH